MKDNKIFDFIQRYYLFIYNVKVTAGVYFMEFATLYLLFGLSSETSIKLDLWTALQMLLACFIIGFSIFIITPYEKFSAKRASICTVLCSFTTIVFSIYFNWFEGFTNWSKIAFYLIIIVGFGLLWPAMKWYTEAEDKKLNYKLKEYQKSLK